MVVGALEITAGEEVTLVSAGGAVERIAAIEIPEQGRRTRGTRLVTLAEDDRVVEVTRSLGTEPDEPEPEDPEPADDEPSEGDDADDGQPDQDDSNDDDPDDDNSDDGEEGQPDLFG